MGSNFEKKDIRDRTKQYQEMFKKCLKLGKDAMLLKATDILDNSYYYHLSKNRKDFKFLINKMKYFIKLSRSILKQELIYRQLVKQYNWLQRV